MRLTNIDYKNIGDIIQGVIEREISQITSKQNKTIQDLFAKLKINTSGNNSIISKKNIFDLDTFLDTKINDINFCYTIKNRETKCLEKEKSIKPYQVKIAMALASKKQDHSLIHQLLKTFIDEELGSDFFEFSQKYGIKFDENFVHIITKDKLLTNTLIRKNKEEQWGLHYYIIKYKNIIPAESFIEMILLSEESDSVKFYKYMQNDGITKLGFNELDKIKLAEKLCTSSVYLIETYIKYLKIVDKGEVIKILAMTSIINKMVSLNNFNLDGMYHETGPEELNKINLGNREEAIILLKNLDSNFTDLFFQSMRNTEKNVWNSFYLRSFFITTKNIETTSEYKNLLSLAYPVDIETLEQTCLKQNQIMIKMIENLLDVFSYRKKPLLKKIKDDLLTSIEINSEEGYIKLLSIITLGYNSFIDIDKYGIFFNIKNTEALEQIKKISLGNIKELASLIKNSDSEFVEFIFFAMENKKIGKHGIEPLFEDNNFFLWNTENLQAFEELLSLGYPVDFDTLEQAFLQQNHTIIELVLKKIQSSNNALFEKSHDKILHWLEKNDDPKVAELVLKYYPEITKKLVFENLKTASDRECMWFFSWLMENGDLVDKDNYKVLIKDAIYKCNLKNIRLIQDFANKQKIDETHYLNILGLDNLTSEELKRKLFDFALHSPLDEVGYLIKHNLEIKNILPEVLELISLLVRFPGRACYHKSIQDITIDEFNSSSIEYAKKNLNFINNLSKNEMFLKMSYLDVLEQMCKDRYSRLDPSHSNSKDYIDKTKTNSKHVTLIIYNEEILPLKKSEEDLTSYPNNEYTYSLRFLNEMEGDKLQFNEKNMVFNFSFVDDKNETITTAITTIEKCLGILEDWTYKNLCWHHNIWLQDSTKATKLMTHLQKLYSDLITFKFNEENKNKFLLKLYEFSYLNSTMCIMSRGTPHNTIMFLALILKQHNLKPFIPKIEKFCSDQYMLMMPWDNSLDGLNKWLSIFEKEILE